MKQLIAITMVLFLIGCDEPSTQELPTRTETIVNVQSHLMDATAFDMEAVISKLKEGKLADAHALQDFINKTPGVNNVDLDHDGSVDEINVKEEKAEDGSLVMSVMAHPSSGEPTAIAELGFQKNTSTGQVEVTGAYPSYVSGSHDHYYHHTLTGSTIGDMMFYSWLFSPRPLYAPVYRAGYYYSSPRSTLSGTQVQNTRTTYRTQNSVSPVAKTVKPAGYTTQSTAAQKTASKYPSTTSGGTLSSKSKQASSFQKSTASSTQKATGFAPRPTATTAPKPAPKPAPAPKSSWGSSSSSKSSWGSSRSSSGFKKSLAKYKNDVEYITDDQRQALAEGFYNTRLATWRYNGEEDLSFGVIIDDLDGSNIIIAPSGEEIDLYSYISVIGAAAQQDHIEIQMLREEVERLRQGICQ